MWFTAPLISALNTLFSKVSKNSPLSTRFPLKALVDLGLFSCMLIMSSDIQLDLEEAVFSFSLPTNKENQIAGLNALQNNTLLIWLLVVEVN
jgi:hypothetical protein